MGELCVSLRQSGGSKKGAGAEGESSCEGRREERCRATEWALGCGASQPHCPLLLPLCLSLPSIAIPLHTTATPLSPTVNPLPSPHCHPTAPHGHPITPPCHPTAACCPPLSERWSTSAAGCPPPPPPPAPAPALSALWLHSGLMSGKSTTIWG